MDEEDVARVFVKGLEEDKRRERRLKTVTIQLVRGSGNVVDEPVVEEIFSLL